MSAPRPVLSLLTAALICSAAMSATAGGLVEPRLHLPSTARQQPNVALTLDACTGKTDGRILDALISNHIPATIFVTGRWLKHNSQTVKTMLAYPELFQIENHGARHLPAIDRPMTVFGLKTAGSAEAVSAEVLGGAAAVLAATGHGPRWFRGATGKYTASAITLIESEGERVAGYSLIADFGAKLGEKPTARRIEAARDGDVIIAHFNHPEKPAGKGVVEGILALKAKGYVFVKLGAPRQASYPSHRSS